MDVLERAHIIDTGSHYAGGEGRTSDHDPKAWTDTEADKFPKS